MTRITLSLLVGLNLMAPAAFADDLMPSPPASTSPPPATPNNPAQPSPQAVAAARAACATDIEKLCPAVQPGGGRVLTCLKQHQDQVTDGCKQAVMKALKPAG
jgi:hypothetical protein